MACTSVFDPEWLVLYTASNAQINGLLFDGVKPVLFGPLGAATESLNLYTYLGRDNLYENSFPPNFGTGSKLNKTYWQECDYQPSSIDGLEALLATGYVTVFYGDAFQSAPDNPGVTYPFAMDYEGAQVLRAFNPGGIYSAGDSRLDIRAGQVRGLGNAGRAFQYYDANGVLRGQSHSVGVCVMGNDWIAEYGAIPPVGAVLTVTTYSRTTGTQTKYEMIGADLTVRDRGTYVSQVGAANYGITSVRSTVQLGTQDIGSGNIFPFFGPDSYSFAAMVVSAVELTAEQKLVIADSFYNNTNSLLCLPVTLTQPTVTACQPCCQLRVKLNWTAVDGAATYEIARDGVVKGTVNAPTLTYTDRTGLQAGTTYEYSVTAKSGSQSGEPGTTSIRVRGFTEDAPVVTTFTQQTTACSTFTEDAPVVTVFTEDGCGCD